MFTDMLFKSPGSGFAKAVKWLPFKTLSPSKCHNLDPIIIKLGINLLLSYNYLFSLYMGCLYINLKIVRTISSFSEDVEAILVKTISCPLLERKVLDPNRPYISMDL